MKLKHMGGRGLFAFILIWWILCPKERKKKLNESQKRYHYYSAQVKSPSIDIGGMHQQYELESSSNNVRYCEDDDTWEVFRLGYGKRIHNGLEGEWEIMDPNLIASFSEKIRKGDPVEIVFPA